MTGNLTTSSIRQIKFLKQINLAFLWFFSEPDNHSKLQKHIVEHDFFKMDTGISEMDKGIKSLESWFYWWENDYELKSEVRIWISFRLNIFSMWYSHTINDYLTILSMWGSSYFMQITWLYKIIQTAFYLINPQAFFNIFAHLQQVFLWHVKNNITHH